MTVEDLRIVYMGTPEFALAPLETLLEAGCRVAAVVTGPDRPAGRGRKVRFSPVKQFALKRGLPLLQPENLKDPVFVEKLRALDPHLQVVVAFRMLPEVVWRIPMLGTFNLHASLLPRYRGAAPIHHAIMNGEKETGVTTFLIDEHIDTGNILLREKTGIGPQETAGELHDRLMVMGASLVLETARQLAAGEIRARSQEEFMDENEQLKKAPKIRREDCLIRWERPAEQVHNQIRGLSPAPGAHTHLIRLGGEKVQYKVYAARVEHHSHRDAPGTIQTDGKRYLKVAVPDGYLHLTDIQQEGKRRMGIGEFLAGFNPASFRPRFS
ncbi:MAG TPA: methionyl-tRNA formyltransferase [Bacteroides sp.]|nr:methionyl-tRNA formyltransferase [Bacteroides sp.]